MHWWTDIKWFGCVWVIAHWLWGGGQKSVADSFTPLWTFLSSISWHLECFNVCTCGRKREGKGGIILSSYFNHCLEMTHPLSFFLVLSGWAYCLAQFVISNQDCVVVSSTFGEALHCGLQCWLSGFIPMKGKNLNHETKINVGTRCPFNLVHVALHVAGAWLDQPGSVPLVEGSHP